MNQNSKLKSPLKCSVFAPSNKSSSKIIVYNHTFNGNKLEGMHLVDYLQPNFALLLFDSRGTGNNNSKYVTLGLRESLDLDLIISYLIKENHYKEIYLWGRSMGAVAIISFLHLNETRISYQKVENLRQEYFTQNKDKKIEKKYAREKKQYIKMFQELFMTLKNQPASFFQDCNIKKQRVKFAIVDAPFKDCHEMLKNIIVNEAGYSTFSAKLVLYFFRNSIWNNLKYDVVGNNRPYKKVQCIKTPVLFLAGDKDTLCHIKDLQKMFDEWGSDIKNFRIMENIDHSSPRTEDDILYCIQQLNEISKKNQVKSQKNIIINKKETKEKNNNEVNNDKQEQINKIEEKQIIDEENNKKSQQEVKDLLEQQKKTDINTLNDKKQNNQNNQTVGLQEINSKDQEQKKQDQQSLLQEDKEKLEQQKENQKELKQQVEQDKKELEQKVQTDKKQEQEVEEDKKELEQEVKQDKKEQQQFI